MLASTGCAGLGVFSDPLRCVILKVPSTTSSTNFILTSDPIGVGPFVFASTLRVFESKYARMMLGSVPSKSMRSASQRVSGETLPSRVTSSSVRVSLQDLRMVLMDAGSFAM
ncbi:unnamed protein product [Phytomonas sp. EM1]|nr:unnamed protein product [Phytomonas sp. EM1]|eukprot:CCW64928.1 unnamed protein product [Phytomonas sp. isolate EM1]